MFAIVNLPLNSRGLRMFPTRFLFKSSALFVGDTDDGVNDKDDDNDGDMFMISL